MPCTLLLSRKNGKTYITKNSDSDNYEIPRQIPKNTPQHGLNSLYNYSGCFHDNNNKGDWRLWMGKNEAGLSAGVSWITLPGTANPNGLKLVNGQILKPILGNYTTINQVIEDLLTPSSILGANNRDTHAGLCVTDKNGEAFAAEIGPTKTVYHILEENEYIGIDNRIRMFDINNEGPAQEISTALGRDAYIEEAAAKYGIENFLDIIQKVTRYVHDKEKDISLYSINESGKWEICNDGTQSSFISESGKPYYYASYGNSPMTSVYLPYSVNEPPAIMDGLRNYIDNEVTPGTKTNNLYDPQKVRAIQQKAFLSENYTHKNIKENNIQELQIKGAEIFKTGQAPQEPPAPNGFQWLPIIILGTAAYLLTDERKHKK